MTDFLLDTNPGSPLRSTAGDATPHSGLVGQVSTDQSPTYTQRIDDVLVRHGIWVTRRDQRQRLAADLDRRLVTVDDVDRLCRAVLGSASNPNIAIGEVLNLLRDDARLRAVLGDLSRVQPVARKWHPGEMDRLRSQQRLAEERAAWADSDREAFLRAMARDGMPADVAEAEWHRRSR